MPTMRPNGLGQRFSNFLRSRIRKLFHSKEIDREYIEGESPEEIGEIGQMTGIPDKSQRHPKP